MAEGRQQRRPRSRRCAPASRAASRTSTPPRCTAAARAEELIGRGDPRHPAQRPLHRQQGAAAERQPRRHARARASRACGGCGTDYLDVYLLHWRGSVPLGRDAGRARGRWSTRARSARSASRTSTSTIWKRRARCSASTRIACNQVLYHLGERHIDAELVPYCAKHDIAVVGYSPFGHGRFPSPSRAGGRALAAVAARHGATPRQVALAFLAREAAAVHDPEGVDGRARRGERRRARTSRSTRTTSPRLTRPSRSAPARELPII